MEKRQAAILICLCLIAVSEVVDAKKVAAWSELLHVGAFWACIGAAALAVMGFLQRSHAEPKQPKEGGPDARP